LNELANPIADLGRTSSFFPEFNVESWVGEQLLNPSFHFGPSSEPGALSLCLHTTRTVNTSQFVRHHDFAWTGAG
jgi:hypothetical protein